MIRNELRYFRNMLRQKTNIEYMIFGTVMSVTLVFFGGLIYFFSPFDIAIKHLFFILMVMIVLSMVFIAYTHERSSIPLEQSIPAIPPKPKQPPTISAQAAATISLDRIHEDVSGKPPPKHYGRRREVFRELVKENGINWLVIHVYTPLPQGLFKKKLWKHKVQKIELDNSRYVNVKLATKVPLFPTNDEEKIYCLMRLHWWSHGPAQIGITAVMLAVITILALVVITAGENSGRVVASTFILVTAIAGSVWYYSVWIQWGFRYLVFTNLKVRLMYRPPFNLPSRTPETDLASLGGGINPSSTWWGNMWGYGSIKTETIAAEVDSWLLKEVNYVPYYEAVAALLSQLRENALNATNH